MARYSFVCKLITKNNYNASIAPVTQNLIVSGDLTPYVNRIEYNNVGIDTQNNATVVLDVPPDGTFVRRAPILVDKYAKHNYLIDVQITSDGNAGKLFRGYLGQVSLTVDESGGEIITIPLIGLEYVMQEMFDSRHDRFVTPKGRFENLLTSSSQNLRGTGKTGTQFTYDTGSGSFPTIDLPDTAPTKQIWSPFGLQTYSDLMSEVIKAQAEAPSTGGTLTDYYFDYIPSSTTTREVEVFAEKFGNRSSGVTLDPLAVTPSGGEDQQTAITDNVMYKNYIIVKGSPTGGSLPVEHTRFASEYIHGMQRNLWSSSATYSKGDPVRTNETEVVDDIERATTRFWRSKVNSNTNHSPQRTRTTADSWWEEDFTLDRTKTIPTQNNTDKAYYPFSPWLTGYLAPSNTATTNGYEGNITNFGKNLVGLNNIPTETGLSWVGYMVDWNIARTNYDRSVTDDFFEQVSVKYVSGFKTAVQLNAIRSASGSGSTALNIGQYDGNKFVVSDNGAINITGGTVSNQKEKIVEWDKETDDWQFSILPTHHWRREMNLHSGILDYKEIRDLINNLDDGRVYKYNDTTVKIVGGGGTGATATATVNSSGVVTGITVTKGGTGYTSNPTIEIDYWTASNGYGAGATATASRSGTSVSSISVTAGGLNYESGSWQIAWEINTDDGLKNFGTPFHLVKEISMATGATGIPNSAVVVSFDWRTAALKLTYPFYLAGSDKHLSSRGAWLNLWFPHPKLPAYTGNDPPVLFSNAGNDYGGNSNYPYINITNQNRNRKGMIGWNQGGDTEDMGTISHIRFKMKLGLYSDETKNQLVFKANFPMIFWVMDKFDRCMKTEFTLRRNDEWQDVIIGIGDGGGMEPFFSRIDEIVKAGDFLLPSDFALLEREYTGVKFDWRYVKCMGWFYKENYTEAGYYNGNAEVVGDTIEESLTQQLPQVENFLVQLWKGLTDPSSGGLGKAMEPKALKTAHSKLFLDELHFMKEQFVVASKNRDMTESLNVPFAGEADPRSEVVRKEEETDYKKCLAIGEGVRARRTFFPQQWHVTALGDARLQLGKSFTVTGSRVPFNESNQQTMNLVCAGIRHIISSDGYYVEVDGVRKFVLQSGETE